MVHGALHPPVAFRGAATLLAKQRSPLLPPQQAAAGPRRVREHPTPLLSTWIPLHRGGQWDRGGAGRFPPAAPACRGPTSLPPAAKRPPLPELPPRAPSACCARRRGPRIPRLFLGWPYQPSCPRAAARLSHHPEPCSSHREPRCRPRGKVGTPARLGGTPRGTRGGHPLGGMGAAVVAEGCLWQGTLLLVPCGMEGRAPGAEDLGAPRAGLCPDPRVSVGGRGPRRWGWGEQGAVTPNGWLECSSAPCVGRGGALWTPPVGSAGSAPLGFADPTGSLLGLPGCWHGVRLRIAPPACRVRAQGRKYPFPHPTAAYCSGLARHGGKIGRGAAV